MSQNDPKRIASSITEDPDVLNEIKIRCKSCGVISDTEKLSYGKYCKACGNALPISQALKTAAAPAASCSADDFDWDGFSKAIDKTERDLSPGDFPSEEDELYTKIPLKSNKPLSPTIDYYSGKLATDLESKVIAICKNKYWEIESSTQPFGYHGRFTVYQVKADLSDAVYEGVQNDKQDQNGIVTLDIGLTIPFDTDSYEDSYA